MKSLPLEKIHERLGARMGEFAGWRMPLDYGSATREVKAVRERAGLFDISHMGRLELAGEDASPVLENLSSNGAEDLEPGRARYTLFLNKHGGIIDDAIIYRHSPSRFYVVVNASNTERDIGWILEHASERIVLANWTEATVFFALQGPLAPQVMEKAGGGAALALKRFSFIETRIAGVRSLISRTGYTGEDGFEVAALARDGRLLWRALMEAGNGELVACGLAARDVLRTEAGYPLHGHEIDEDTNPVEAGLTRFVRLDERDFVGRAAVIGALSRPQSRALVGAVMEDRSVPRRGDRIFVEGRQAGRVTSGTFSPTISRGIALAFIESELAKEGRYVEVEIRGTRRPGRLLRPPLYVRRSGNDA